LHYAIFLGSPLTAILCLSTRRRLPPFFKSNIHLEALPQVARIEVVEPEWRLPYPKSHISLFTSGLSGANSVHPEMVFLANLGVNLHVCLCGHLQVASAQALDFLDIGKNPHFRIGNSVLPGNHFRMDTN